MPENGLKIKRVKIDAIHSDPGNVRRHDERNLQAITDSIKAFGQVEPLVVQKSSGKVIGGNARQYSHTANYSVVQCTA